MSPGDVSPLPKDSEGFFPSQLLSLSPELPVLHPASCPSSRQNLSCWYWDQTSYALEYPFSTSMVSLGKVSCFSLSAISLPVVQGPVIQENLSILSPSKTGLYGLMADLVHQRDFHPVLPKPPRREAAWSLLGLWTGSAAFHHPQHLSERHWLTGRSRLNQSP